MDHGRRIKALMLSEIKQRRDSGQRFSITLDEWTSTRNRRYMTVNLHGRGTFWNLGLARVEGSMPAEKCIELLDKKLAEFELNLSDDIVSICTDGASVMRKVGNLIKPKQQLCYLHGIHLAVTDVLYKKCQNF